jgi:hypothetical protein
MGILGYVPGISRSEADGRYVLSQNPAPLLSPVFGGASAIYSTLFMSSAPGSPQITFQDAGGTLLAPTASLAGLSARVTSECFDGTVMSSGGALVANAEENWSPTGKGLSWRFSGTGIGETSPRVIAYFRTALGAANSLELLGTVSRVVPNAIGQLRNPFNTGNVVEWGADTLGFHNAAPITIQTIVGSRGGNAALADLLTKGATKGLWIDGTTP